jgi:hypothetical protein
MAQSRADSRSELTIFHRDPGAEVSEDWSEDAWEEPWSPAVDKRSRILDAAMPAPFSHLDYALYGDGGYNGKGATSCAQARSSGTGREYWPSSACVSEKLTSLLPLRYGNERPMVHTAEMVAMLNSLRWRTPGGWNLAVYDRSALFHVLNQVCGGNPRAMKGINLAPLACRLRHICMELRDAATALPSPPSWRMQQVHMPHMWNVRRPVGGRPKWFSKLPSAAGDWSGWM